MGRSERELAFLRDLHITDDYTTRFTELADRHISLDQVEGLLYLNVGTGNHCLALCESAEGKAAVHGICENSELLSIARDKAAAVGSDVRFSVGAAVLGAFDAVIADASLTPPDLFEQVMKQAVQYGRSGARFYFMLPSSGSFGEIFSVLWEALSNTGSGSGAAIIENMISSLPTTSKLEELANAAGLAGVETHVGREIFEYADGSALAASPLIADFFIPAWLKGLSETERDEILDAVSRLIDAEGGDLTFRFSVKPTLLTGTKE
ncbi:MAG TPA: class I SAM-dependent methyltransferase [Pyrinomonadaceae bacterium]|nr:class I SAM-dependent methyltransferase [Pyrinomonadaceae bacterium]HMP64288.1 class I SAM-dependent methyltransferase [Pyrinomonadaceae bacterium]